MLARPVSALRLGLVLALLSPAALGSDCEPANGISPCVDSNNLWLSPGSARFVGIAATETLAPGAIGFGLGGSWQSRPIILVAPSPDPDGREVRVLDDVIDATFLLAWGVADRFEIGLAAPVVLHQSGSGVEGVTTQSADPLGRMAIRDPRVSAAIALVPRPPDDLATLFGAKARFELSLPAGDEQLLAGSSGLGAAPSVTADVRAGRFSVGSEIGARFRKSTEFATATIGTQLFTSLGLGLELAENELLSAAVEAWLLPALTSQERDLPNGARVESATLVPAEWMASVRSAPFAGGDFVAQLGGGTALPLSSSTTIGPDGTRASDTFAGVTAPRFRFTLVLRYAPLDRDRDADGVPDRSDPCPAAAEDKDGFEDADGCPEADNDGDGVPDTRDRCRDAAETVDGFEDDDGCPDLDDDDDGVLDEVDRCRMEPEDRDGMQDDDGCADRDTPAIDPPRPEPEREPAQPPNAEPPPPPAAPLPADDPALEVDG